MNKSSLVGLYRQQQATQHILAHGTTLTVQRKAASATAQPTTQSLTCIPTTDSKAQDALIAEGDVNAANAQPMTFIFKGTDTIVENADRVIYHGWYYKLASVYPTGEQNGVVISWTARAVRDGKAS